MSYYPLSHPSHDARPQVGPPSRESLPRWERLTKKEMRALRLLLDLGSNPAVAKAMKTTGQVIRNLLHVIYLKVGVSSKLELVMAWMRDHPAPPLHDDGPEAEFWQVLQRTLDIVNQQRVPKP